MRCCSTVYSLVYRSRRSRSLHWISDSLKDTAKSMAEDMMSFYHGDEPGNTPGLLPDPYYWWEGGALMGALIDYWYYTGDTTYNNVTTQGMLAQVGPQNDYMPPEQRLTEGNDDQGFWGMAAMSAAEYKFPDPPAGKPGWLALAQAVFNTQAARWEPNDCGGGLLWQIFNWNKGYDYKNSISQACFFNIAARLALYTGNSSYADWAEKTWDWMESSKLLNTENYWIYDGVHITNCSDITVYQWTYNVGGFLLGAAAMYNYSDGTKQEVWRERTQGLLNGSEVFFTGSNKDIMTEVACEPVNLCDIDQQSFKAYLSRWMAATTKWAPWTYNKIKPLMESSAKAAAAQCNGGDNKRMCGLKWTDNGTWDGTTGVGQQMAAMEVVLANMIANVTAPASASSGGTSVGDPGAGGDDQGKTNPDTVIDQMRPITTGDQAGAGILTAVVALMLILAIAWLLVDETSHKSGLHQVSRFGIILGTGSFLRKSYYGGHGGSTSEKGKENDRASSSADSSDGNGAAFMSSAAKHNKKFSVIETHHAMDFAPPMTETQGPLIPPFQGHKREPSEPPVPPPTVLAREFRASGQGERQRNSLRKQATQNSRAAATRSPLE
ncbi:hydrolase 76 protein, variant 2 [Coniochaeta pulveracea]|uniref:mannan endo-1,6-alpha-mannosidase n=1 Tax=Coniochaeta pulveracea TaxID=177199 RepID=A0A420XYL7_9PEZI|nr:hydrolase 76 protein, variant 2 [Coniochaeta pulveracea]